MTDPNRQLGIDELAASYGYAAAFFNSDPELKSIITQAVQGQWTPDRFKAAFLASQWYRTRSADLRQWQELEIRDPATAAQRVTNQVFVLTAMANQMGISLPADRLKAMARDSLMFGWEENQLKQSVAAEFKYAPGGTQGAAATLEDRIRQHASDYGVDLPDYQVGEWVGGALAGRYTEDHLRDFARDMARSKYPGMGYWLDQGMTVRQVAAPYMRSYADLLEVSEDTVDLREPMVQQALQGSPGQAGKPPTMKSLWEFERDLRKDSRWLHTRNARDTMRSSALGVLRDMGLYA